MRNLKEILNDYKDGGSTEQEAISEVKFILIVACMLSVLAFIGLYYFLGVVSF